MKSLVEPSEIRDLAPMPATVVRLASMACDPEAEVADMAEVDRVRPGADGEHAAAGQLVLERLEERHRDRQGRAALGWAWRRVLQLAVGGTRVARLMEKSCPGYDLGEHELWRHSIAAALAAEKMGAHATGRCRGRPLRHASSTT